MKRVKKLVGIIVLSLMASQMIPITVLAETNAVNPPEAFGPTPNESQLQYHEEELAAFIHFGMNTFTNVEWGNGRENPNTFNPTDLDVDDWVKTLKDAGFKRLIMVGKHHDGFAIWKSEVSEHDVEKSVDWQETKGGEGDLLEELSIACTKYDMDMGIYLSPWDANAPSYGYGTGTDDATDSNGDYNEFYMAQLREILGNDKYGNNGKFVEVWMDGAKGSGAAAQKYKFDEWFQLIEELQPGALVFSPYGTTVRWIGNESGKAGDPAWSKVNKKRIRDRYDAGLGEDVRYLNNGDPNGDIWSVGEADVSLTSGWFWHAGNEPKNMEQLTDIYFSSVGRGQPLLLNVAPDNTGNFTAKDIARVKDFSNAINNTFRNNLAPSTTATATASEVRGNSNDYSAANVLDDNHDTYWTMDDGKTTGSLTIDLGEKKNFDVVSIEEYIKLGQRISEFSVEVYSDGVWNAFGEGYTIGAKRLVRGAPVNASKIRINIESSLATPLIENVEVFKGDKAFEIKSIAPSGTTFIDNVNFNNKNNWNQETIGIGNTGMYSNTTGNNTSFSFTGTKAWVIGTFDPSHGIMEVWIDDKKVTEVDTYSAKRSISQILYETPDLQYGNHTVKLVVKGDKNPLSRGNHIGLDGAYYLNNNEAGMFEIENTSYTVEEGKEKEIVIKRVAGSKGKATVHFSTSPDTAVHGRHYNDVNKTIEFADGQTEARVNVKSIDNTEKSGNLKFYINIDTPSNGAIIGFNKNSEVTIIDNDEDNVYTEANPFKLPTTLEEKKLLEGEEFTLDPITGTNYVRIENNTSASNGKVVGWFESGNKIKVPFYASKPGVYTFNMSYQSGRSEGNLNKINWSGTNIESGSSSVPGTGNQNPVPIIKTSFDVVVTKAGAGELVFTADAQSSPNIDVFEVSAKSLVEATHNVTATAGENGSINPSGVVNLKEGESKTFNFTANEGYEVSDVIVDGVSKGALSSYTVENIKDDVTINVTFKLKEDTDTYSEDNPFVLPTTLEEKKLLEAEKFILDPITGTNYVRIENNTSASNGKVVGWFESGNKIKVPFYASKPGVYTFNMSYQSGRSEGNLNKINWSGTNIESGSSSVPGTGNQNPVPIIKTSFDVVVTKAGAGELIFTADAQSSPNIDVFEVSAKSLVEATHNVTVTAGENGSVSPSGVVSLKEGESKTFDFIANEGYEVSDVIVDGVSKGAISSYTVENITKNITINVTFKLKEEVEVSHNVTVTVGENGSVTPSGVVNLKEGESKTFNFIANEGYEVSDVIVDGVSKGAISSYTVENITKNITINVTFKLKEEVEVSHNVTVTAGENGSVSPSGVISLKEGESKTFTFTANEGYEIADVVVDGVSKGAISSYTVENIKGDVTISVTFKLKEEVEVKPEVKPEDSNKDKVTIQGVTAGSKDRTNKLPNTGSALGQVSSIIGVGLSSIGVILFKKKYKK